MNKILLQLTLLLAVSLAALAEVTVLRSVQVLYDKSPKLRIRGSGFDADDHEIILEIGASGSAASLRVDKDYLITKDDDGDGLILKLVGNRRWAKLDNRNPPVAIVLSSVKFSEDGKNQLPEPVIVGQVLSTPSVEENEDVIYMTATNELRIDGLGFIGAKKVDLFFDPPLVKEVAYEDVTRYPLTKDQVVLRIRHGYEWREDAGELSVVGVDTGGGPVKLNGDDGVVVAVVEENMAEHSVSVDVTAEEQLIYNDEPNLIISGDGFSEVGNALRFANGLLGNNVNYTTLSTSEDTIQLRLAHGSFWRKNAENLPGALTLLAVNAGEGFVAVGPTNAGKGRDIAMVFERPNIFSGNKKLYRTHSHMLEIRGKGFPEDSEYVPLLKFDPPLVDGDDYSVNVIDRTTLEITLNDGGAWRDDAGPLLITAVNTRGDDAGWVDMAGDGIHVAEVVEDIDAAATGGVEVFPMGVKVYQSALQQSVVITGTGFKEGMSFVFYPELKVDTDYDLEVQSKNKVVLRLKAGKKWRSTPGFVLAKSIKIDKSTFNLAGSEGIRVAVVLADPSIISGKDVFHESQTKLIVISGSGFTNAADTSIVIRPTSPGAYKVLGVIDDAIRVQLKPDQDWLPSFMSLEDEDSGKRVTLQIASIDTGAGDIVFDEPITVGFVVQDREGVVCDDSCEFSFDGVCDDGTDPNDMFYFENYNNYMDDDLGGFYGEPDDFDGDGVAYGIAYDDYYMENEDYSVSACVEGTDCTDCGGVDAIVDYSRPLDPESGFTACTNTCMYPRDGVCDDPRGTKYCELGTDCQDCGPVGADNFTRSDDDGWWDDDDDYWTFNDGNFLDQAKGLDANRHKVRTVIKEESAGPAAMFLVVLEGMVYTVGAIFAAAALYLLNRWYKGQSVPFMNVFNPESSQNSSDFELAPTRRMPITPDVIRT